MKVSTQTVYTVKPLTRLQQKTPIDATPAMTTTTMTTTIASPWWWRKEPSFGRGGRALTMSKELKDKEEEEEEEDAG